MSAPQPQPRDGGDRAPQLPPMSDALLDDAALDALFNDIAALAEVDGVLLKWRPGHVGAGATATLADARRLLGERAVRGVQIRYRHDGGQWMDTLLVTQDGVRLVRIRHDL